MIKTNPLSSRLTCCLLFGLSTIPAFSFVRPCQPCCSTGHHKRAMVDFGKGWMSFALAGFGYGEASQPVVCDDDGGNPQFTHVSADWTDFRFYGKLPGIGIFKATLNRDHRSFVELTAKTPDGLFPATFRNTLYLTLTLPGMPGMVYENTDAMILAAPATPSAPPAPSVGLWCQVPTTSLVIEHSRRLSKQNNP